MMTEFLITSLIVVLLPGTGVLYTVSTGLTQGARASLFASLGCTAGIIPHLCASALGVAAILHTSAIVFQLFKLCGVIYLLYLAWVMWKESGAIHFHSSSQETSYKKIAMHAFLVNILNPKLSIFFLAFLPQFIPNSSASAIAHMLLLSSIFMLMTLIVFTAYGLLANQVRYWVLHSPKLIQGIQKAFAGMFVALGIKLALMER